MGSLSGLMLIAGAGMLKGQGFQPNPDIATAQNKFSTDNLSGIIQSILPTASAPVRDSLSLLPSFLSGMAPAGVDLPPGVDDTDLVKSVKTQSDSLLSNGVSGFTNIFAQASGHTATSFSFAGALAQSQGKKFDDLGFTFKSYDDVLTGGISSQFNMATLPSLGAELSNFGTLFDVTDLTTMTTPGSVCANLIKQGLGGVGNLSTMLEEQLLDLENLPNENQTLIKNIMAEITGSDLDEIFAVTNFVPPENAIIRNLADILNINNLLTPKAQSALGDQSTLDDLGRKIGNVGGKFKSFSEIGTLYSSVETNNFPRLKELGTLLPDSLDIDLSGSIGKGSGELGNPTMADMVGSAGGIGYVKEMNKAADLQQDLLNNDSDVQALAQYLSTATNINVVTLDQLIYNINSKPELQEPIEKGQDAMIHIAERLSIEKTNLDVAGINLNSRANPQGIMGLAGNLHGHGVDPMNLGLGSILTSVATDDVYGDAVQASLVEGRNLGRLSVFGIKPGTKMDAMSYANSLKGVSY